MLSAMVKTLGSSTQALRMRSACARCISNTVQSLVKIEQEQLDQQQQQQEDGDDGSRTPRSDAAVVQQQGATRAGAAPTAASPAGAAGAVGRSPSPLRPDLAAAGPAAGTGTSPSPSASPRSAPMAASFEELCAEPKLLDNLLLCLNPEKCVEVARKARAEAAAPGLGPGAAEEAEELARNAVRAVSVILLVGYWAMHCCVVWCSLQFFLDAAAACWGVDLEWAALGAASMRKGCKQHPAVQTLGGVTKQANIVRVCCCCCHCRLASQCRLQPGFPWTCRSAAVSAPLPLHSCVRALAPLATGGVGCAVLYAPGEHKSTCLQSRRPWLQLLSRLAYSDGAACCTHRPPWSPEQAAGPAAVLSAILVTAPVRLSS